MLLIAVNISNPRHLTNGTDYFTDMLQKWWISSSFYDLGARKSILLKAQTRKYSLNEKIKYSNATCNGLWFIFIVKTVMNNLFCFSGIMFTTDNNVIII